MNRRSRQILTMAAMACAAGTLPFEPIISVYWLGIAYLVAPSNNRVAPEIVRRLKPRDLLRRLR